MSSSGLKPLPHLIPASRTRTETFGSSVRRFASANPAVPAGVSVPNNMSGYIQCAEFKQNAYLQQ